MLHKITEVEKKTCVINADRIPTAAAETAYAAVEIFPRRQTTVSRLQITPIRMVIAEEETAAAAAKDVAVTAPSYAD